MPINWELGLAPQNSWELGFFPLNLLGFWDWLKIYWDCKKLVNWELGFLLKINWELELGTPIKTLIIAKSIFGDFPIFSVINRKSK